MGRAYYIDRREHMAKDREIQCIHYKSEGICALGKKGTFRHQCQTCKTYKKLPGGLPARKNLKKEKLEKYQNDKRHW